MTEHPCRSARRGCFRALWTPPPVVDGDGLPPMTGPEPQWGGMLAPTVVDAPFIVVMATLGPVTEGPLGWCGRSAVGAGTMGWCGRSAVGVGAMANVSPYHCGRCGDDGDVGRVVVGSVQVKRGQKWVQDQWAERVKKGLIISPLFSSVYEWAMTGSNRRPPRCKRGALAN